MVIVTESTGVDEVGTEDPAAQSGRLDARSALMTVGVRLRFWGDWLDWLFVGGVDFDNPSGRLSGTDPDIGDSCNQIL